MVTTATMSRPRDVHSTRSSCCGAPVVHGLQNRTLFPWQGRGWPSSAAEEHAFVTELADRCDDVTEPHTRADVTLLLNALRSGITLDELLGFAPGLKPTRLLSAYRDLGRRRSEAVAALDRILCRRDAEAVLRHSPVAGTLLPALMTQLELTAMERPEQLPAAIERCEQRMQVASDLVSAYENRIARCVDGCVDAARIGSRLFHPEQPSAWSDVFYVPARVGDMVPERVVALLHERSIER